MRALAIVIASGVLAYAQPPVRTSKTARYDKLPPYSAEPVDPWLGVENDQPARIESDGYVARATAHNCTAAADHCLHPRAWFFEKTSPRRRNALRVVSVHPFGPTGAAFTINSTIRTYQGNPYIAYRTVPATKTNLVVGGLAIALSRPHAIPHDGRHAVDLLWSIGVVEAVDFELGTVKLENHEDTALLSSARVPVLSWKEGGKVQILGGKKRNELAARKQDVFLPPRE